MASSQPVPDRTPPHWGGPLTEADFATLAASWITPELALQGLLRRVDAEQGRQVLGQKGKRDCSGMLIPYFWPGELSPFTYRVRRDKPEMRQDKDGRLKPEGKYLAPIGDGNRLYVPPGVMLEQLGDVTIPIVLVEGEKKALALWRLANYQVETPRFIPIAIGGVWNWRGRIGKTNGPSGERLDVHGPIADLSRIEWKGRKAHIVFDADVNRNDNVKWARKGFARELASRGAEVGLITLPEDCSVNGVDDLLVAWGPERVLELFAKPSSDANVYVKLSTQFKSEPDGMFRITAHGERLSRTQLTNYRASVTASVTLDDGAETRREFEIEAQLPGRQFQFTLPAAQFTSMDWPVDQMGPGAITFPNQREYARTAIQSYSLTAPERFIYTHTGWRKVNGQWIYLHANGAIGAGGSVQAVSVRLNGPLRLYNPLLPASKEALVRAVRASLRILELAPGPIAFSLLAATSRAVFGDSDFSLHLAGATGAFKSELAALAQQHFGAGMTRLNLPGTWSSTSNALEAITFHAKDALIVVDDFAPQGSATDVSRYHAAADRVFRAAGNHSGRGRLDSTAKLREAKPPRGLILSTGEEIPRGHSVRARLWILEISKGAIDPVSLSACQRDAGAGLYSEAMGGFLQWIAGDYEDKRSKLNQRAADLRTLVVSNTAHARTPDIISHLQAGFELYVVFAEEFGAITTAERQQLENRCWTALKETAATQAKHHQETEPAARYLSLIRACVASGQAHLASRMGTEPTQFPESCGWRVDGSGKLSPKGHLIGWIDGDEIYLEPTAALRSVQTAGRDLGETLALSEPTMRKRLHEKGLLASTDPKRGTLTVRRVINGSSMGVLHFKRTTILPEAEDEEDGDVG